MWIRLDDGFADHPKLLNGGIVATAIQIRAICYAARHLTDGALPEGIIPSLFMGLDHLALEVAGDPMAAPTLTTWIDKMLEAGLWHRTPTGYRIHDYLKYQPSRKEILQHRADKAKAGHAGGLARARHLLEAQSKQSEDSARRVLQPHIHPELHPQLHPKKKQKQPPTPTPSSAGAEAVPAVVGDGHRAPWPSPEALARLYNELTTDNVPSVKSLSAQRRRKASALLRQFPDEQWWRDTFAAYHRSDFLSGHSKPKPGHEGFVPDFDWLLSNGLHGGTENAVKVHDGRYEGG